MRALLLIPFCCFFFKECINFKKLISKSNKGKIIYESECADESLVCILPAGIDPATNWEEWTAYLSKNLLLDDASMDTIPPGTYTVFVQFVIDNQGSLSDIKIVKDPGFGLGKKVKDVISQYKNKWKPAESFGRTILSYRKQPVTFIIEEEEACKEKLPGELIP